MKISLDFIGSNAFEKDAWKRRALPMAMVLIGAFAL
jgi:hypothetical protein